MKRPQLSFGLACLLMGCTWTRFDDVTDNPPVERFDVPSDVSGAGLALATFTGSNGAYLGATSPDSLLLYSLGNGAAPSRGAIASQACAANASCVIARQIAGIGPSVVSGNQGCIAYGVGLSDAGTATASGKVFLLCEAAELRSLAVPDSITAWLTGQRVSKDTVATLATTRRGNSQPLAASIPDARVTWFYDGVDPTPIELPALPDDAAAGRSLAVTSDGTGFVVVAGSVTTNDTLWLYRISGDRTATVAGCVQGSPQFGRLLATGNFDEDGVDDLVIADDQHVFIVSGSSIAAIAQGATGSCTSIDTLGLIGNAQCSQLPDIDGCAGSPYAAALVTGNLDASGPDELIVGAPLTSVRGEGGAGAAFIYRWNSSNLQVVQGLYVSTAAGGNLLGTSLAVANVSDVDTVMAGAPGDNTVMAFYCNSLMPAQTKSARCN